MVLRTDQSVYGAAAGAVIAHRRAKHERALAEEQVATQSQQAQQANRVTNAAAANRNLSEWARELRERLDEVHGVAKQ